METRALIAEKAMVGIVVDNDFAVASMFFQGCIDGAGVFHWDVCIEPPKHAQDRAVNFPRSTDR